LGLGKLVTIQLCRLSTLKLSQLAKTVIGTTKPRQCQKLWRDSGRPKG